VHKKVLLAKCLYVSKLLPVIKFARQKMLQDILILAYHRVKDIENIDAYEFDAELVSASSADFYWQMEFVKKHYNPIRFSDFIEYLDGKKSLPPNPLIVTFDDGFEDNYSVVFPILKQLDVPATIFISSDYIGKTETFWFDWVVYLLKKAPPGRLHLPDIPLDLTIDDSPDSKMSAMDILLGALKQVSNQVRLQSIKALEQQLGLSQPSEGFAESCPMTWQQVKEMSEWGVDFGSHSATHPILSQLDSDELWYEISNSRETIVEQIGESCDVIAYPVGGACTYDQRVLDMVKQVGYRLGTSYRSGVNVLDDLEPYALQRIHVELDTSHELFAATLALPSLFVTKYTLTKL